MRAACRRIHEELKAVGESPRLAERAAAAAGTALQLLAERAEYMAASGPEVRSQNLTFTTGAFLLLLHLNNTERIKFVDCAVKILRLRVHLSLHRSRNWRVVQSTSLRIL